MNWQINEFDTIFGRAIMAHFQQEREGSVEFPPLDPDILAALQDDDLFMADLLANSQEPYLNGHSDLLNQNCRLVQPSGSTSFRPLKRSLSFDPIADFLDENNEVQAIPLSQVAKKKQRAENVVYQAPTFNFNSFQIEDDDEWLQKALKQIEDLEIEAELKLQQEDELLATRLFKELNGVDPAQTDNLQIAGELSETETELSVQEIEMITSLDSIIHDRERLQQKTDEELALRLFRDLNGQDFFQLQSKVNSRINSDVSITKPAIFNNSATVPLIDLDNEDDVVLIPQFGSLGHEMKNSNNNRLDFRTSRTEYPGSTYHAKTEISLLDKTPITNYQLQPNNQKIFNRKQVHFPYNEVSSYSSSIPNL
ncbi:hypothetical protein HK096_003435, partial [Nowakowskiella sp. JEL0078]